MGITGLSTANAVGNKLPMFVIGRWKTQSRPPNITSYSQPIDQGVIKRLIYCYRERSVNIMIQWFVHNHWRFQYSVSYKYFLVHGGNVVV